MQKFLTSAALIGVAGVMAMLCLVLSEVINRYSDRLDRGQQVSAAVEAATEHVRLLIAMESEDSGVTFAEYLAVADRAQITLQDLRTMPVSGVVSEADSAVIDQFSDCMLDVVRVLRSAVQAQLDLSVSMDAFSRSVDRLAVAGYYGASYARGEVRQAQAESRESLEDYQSAINARDAAVETAINELREIGPSRFWFVTAEELEALLAELKSEQEDLSPAQGETQAEPATP